MARPKQAKRPTPTNSKEIRKNIELEKGPQYHDPGPPVRLLGETNETKIILYKGLVNSWLLYIYNYQING